MKRTLSLAAMLIACLGPLTLAGPGESDPLPSRNDGPSKAAIVGFITEVTEEGSPDFVKPAERVAVFDNDGTLWSEQPMYLQFVFMLDQIKTAAPRHPEWKDNPAWVKAIEDTKRKTLLIAGTLTSVCMSFPTLSALVAGHKVFTIVDASGNWSTMATDITLARVVQAGAMPIDTYAVLAELMSTWNRPDATAFAAVMVDHIVPPYRALMESYDKAQSVQKGGRETRLERLEAALAKE